MMPNAVEQFAQLEDPSDMKKDQIVALLQHWRRPVPGRNLFRFSHILVNSKSREMEWALYDNSLGPRSLPQNSLPSAFTQLAPVDTEYRNPNSLSRMSGEVAGPQTLILHSWNWGDIQKAKILTRVQTQHWMVLGPGPTNQSPPTWTWQKFRLHKFWQGSRSTTCWHWALAQTKTKEWRVWPCGLQYCTWSITHQKSTKSEHAHSASYQI